MSFVGATDIIMDPSRGADPVAADEARQKLAAMAGARKTSNVRFEARSTAAQAAGSTQSARASFEKFEAFVLQTFIQSMLPEDTQSFYGQGLSGDMWKSMLAEHLAGHMTKAGGIGIADRILADYYRRGEEIVPLQGATEREAGDNAQSRSLLNVSLVQQMQRRAVHALEAPAPATGVTATERS